MLEADSTTCSVTLLDDSTVIDSIRRAVDLREPFSMIRINDGEAVALAFDDDMWLQDVTYLQSHWGGERMPLRAISEVRDDLLLAIRNADVVGIRDDIVGVPLPADLVERSGAEVRDIIARELPLRPQERERLTVSSARRIALLQRAMVKTDWSSSQQLCSCWVHWEMLATGALNEILESVDRVGLVTSRPELQTMVSRRYDIPVDIVLVPDKFVEAHQSGAHVPDRYRTMRPDLRFEPGTLVLVGTGIPGKVYCDWLKQAGCVAIDVGAVFDAWVGKASRPRVLESRFEVRGGNRVPIELQLRDTPARPNRALTPRWKASRSPS